MNFMGMTQFDTANGLGIGTVLWVAGCEHHCLGCHNPQTHSVNAGRLFTSDDLDALVNTFNNPFIKRLTLSGGDPLHPQNRHTALMVARQVKLIHPLVKVWLYTGYKWEEIQQFDRSTFQQLSHNVDYMVEGRYIEQLRDLNLKFRGSSNQRIFKKFTFADWKDITFTME